MHRVNRVNQQLPVSANTGADLGQPGRRKLEELRPAEGQNSLLFGGLLDGGRPECRHHNEGVEVGG